MKSKNEQTTANKTTQQSMILEYLNTNNSITPLEALSYFGIYRLSAIIYDLRHKYGYDISTKTQKTLNRQGKITYFAKYTLNDKIGHPSMKSNRP